MTEKRRCKPFKGAVLIMVITVMFVLMVMLMATLSAVSTSNRRSVLKYEENQAYYAARSGLDSFLAVLNSNDYHAWDSSAGTPMKYSVSDDNSNNIKQSRALQLEFYKLMVVRDDGTGIIDNTLGLASNITSSDSVYPTGSYGDRYFTAETNRTHLKYEITFPPTGDGHSRFADGDRAEVKVELVDRLYASQFTEEEIHEYVNGNTSIIADDEALKAAIRAGDRSKDRFYAKITVTTWVNGVPGVAVAYVNLGGGFTSPPGDSGGAGLQVTGTSAAGSGAATGFNGGFSSLNPGVTTMSDAGNISGTLFTVGSFYWSATGTGWLNQGDRIVAQGDFVVQNSTTFRAHAQGTYLFVGNELSFPGGGAVFGDATNSVSVIASTFVKPANSSAPNVHGNVYATTFVTGTEDTDFNVSGTTYVRDLVLSGGAPNSRLGFIEGANILICLDGRTTGEYVVFDEDGNGIYTYAEVASGMAAGVGVINANAFHYEIFTYDYNADGRIERRYTLPAPLHNTTESTIIVPTAQFFYASYFVETPPSFKANGDLISVIHSATINDMINAPGYVPRFGTNLYWDAAANTGIYSEANVEALMLTAGKLLQSYLGTTADTIAGIVSELSVPVLPNTRQTISVSSGDQLFVLRGNYNNNLQLTVTGSGGRLILMIEEDETVGNFQNAAIRYNDPEWFQIANPGEGSGDFPNPIIALNSQTVVNYETTPPAIDIYGGTNSHFYFREPAAWFTAYFIMPSGKMTLNRGSVGGDVQYWNKPEAEGGFLTPVPNTAIMGAVICREMDSYNAPGIVYISKEKLPSNPGSPVIPEDGGEAKASSFARR
ncbi:MAG: hypothetical protein FWG90_05160 [Oscillospiraceae bacterium]|nr:hypothetical protein [Oscillospiraceae bacterium]